MPINPNQQLLANKQVRWWWNNQRQAIYDDGDGSGWSPHGPYTEWVPNSKSIIFAEYGICATDRGTNQPNVFYDPKSVESFTAYWSIWDPAEGDVYLPRRDDEIQLLALQAIYEYWVTDGNNETVGGVPMIQTAFMSVWNWDARPFPTFPELNELGRYRQLACRAMARRQGSVPDAAGAGQPPAPGPYPAFPALPTLGWSVTFRRSSRLLGAACLRPGDPRREMAAAALEDRAELRNLADGVAEHRTAADHRLLRTEPARMRRSISSRRRYRR